MLKPEQIARFRKKLMADRRAIEARIAAKEGDIVATVRDEEGVGDSVNEAQLVYYREGRHRFQGARRATAGAGQEGSRAHRHGDLRDERSLGQADSYRSPRSGAIRDYPGQPRIDLTEGPGAPSSVSP